MSGGEVTLTAPVVTSSSEGCEGHPEPLQLLNSSAGVHFAHHHFFTDFHARLSHLYLIYSSIAV